MKLTRIAATLTVAALALGLSFAAYAAAEPAKSQILKYNLGAEPATLDPHLSTGIPESTVEYNVFEGLTRYDEANNPVPACAESWSISKDGLTYTFKIRKGAKWSDGSPVTADDFVYAWQRLLDPKTASEYAYQGYYIKNGEAINSGKVKDLDKLGAVAKDANTLVVTLESPTGYFLGVLAHTSMLPVKKAAVEKGEGWATKPATLIGNGAFKLKSWEHNSALTLVPNPEYWNAKSIKLDQVDVTLIDSQNTALTMFETDQIDYTDNIPVAEMGRLRKEGKVKIGSYIGTYYYMFNTKKAPFSDVKVRKAFAYAIDRGAITEFITKGGQLPAMAFVPGGMADAKKGADFRAVGGTYFKDNDVAAAKKLLKSAGFEGGKGLPPISILYNTSESHKKIAEAVQELWKKNLGAAVTLKNQEWQVYLDSRNAGAFEVARAGWIGDYPDPMTFLDMWTTGNGNNDTGWGNKRYDKLIDQAKSTADQATRVKAMHEAEDILMAEMPVMPIYFYTLPYLQKPWVQDLLKSSLGYTDFDGAWISKH